MMRYIVAVLLSILLVGCGSSSPSESQAREVMEASTLNVRRLGATVIDFRKLNGESREREGQKIYEYTFLAALELPDGIVWRNRDFYSKDNVFVISDTDPFTRLPKGTTAIWKGVIEFRYTEKGWVWERVPENVNKQYCTELKAEACYKRWAFETLE